MFPVVLLSFLALAIPVFGTQPADHETQQPTRQAGPLGVSAVQGQDNVTTAISQELADGEAAIWYLGHCGWAIKTKTRLMIFDYWEQDAIEGEASLTTGRINPAELRDLDVYMFVSHAHGDHYDRTILDWARTVPNITYIFGWDAGLDPSFIYMREERAERTFGDMQVFTVNHSFDRIPEVAYLVKVDGLVIYHSGDHASTTEVPNETFSGNIDYFASLQESVDLAFISTFGRRGGAIVNNGDLYTIERLRPRTVFPMHHGGGEDLNQRFADQVADRVAPTSILAARHLGDEFFYSNGQTRRIHR